MTDWKQYIPHMIAALLAIAGGGGGSTLYSGYQNGDQDITTESQSHLLAAAMNQIDDLRKRVRELEGKNESTIEE